MLVKVGIVRDGQIVETKWLNSQECALVPMFEPHEFEAVVKAYREGGPTNVHVMAPTSLQKDPGCFMKWAMEGWNEFLSSIPSALNPRFKKANGKPIVIGNPVR